MPYRRDSSDDDDDDDESSDDNDDGDQSQARSTLFSKESLTFTEAAAILLRGATTPDEVLTRLMLTDHLEPHLITSPCIDSHDLLLLPQHRRSARVHRFVLAPEVFLPLGAQLARVAEEQRDASGGIHVSNVDGWHSSEEMFEFGAAGSSASWYGGLRGALSDALHALDRDTRLAAATTNAASTTSAAASLPLMPPALPASADVPLADREVSGWLNSSGRRAYNTLHDHGRPVEGSLVLFVRTGDEAGPPEEAEDLPGQGQQGETDRPGAATDGRNDEHPRGGSLLMKTQPDGLRPNEQAYLAVPPTPGELWAFQGEMLHAVLPREIGQDGAGADVAPRLQARQRISVAMNVYRAAPRAAPAMAGKALMSGPTAPP